MTQGSGEEQERVRLAGAGVRWCQTRRGVTLPSEAEKGSNSKIENASLDLRYTVPRGAKVAIVDRVAKGETQAEVAGDGDGGLPLAGHGGAGGGRDK